MAEKQGIYASVNRKNIEKLFLDIDKHYNAWLLKVGAFILKDSKKFARHIQDAYFISYKAGKKTTKLQSRSGELKRSIVPRNITVNKTDKTMTGGVAFNKHYAGVHIGPKSQATNIFPVNKRALTIPLPGGALDSRGVLIGPARSKKFGETFIAKGIIFQKAGIQPKSAVFSSRAIRPLFLLRKTVTVRTRIHTDEIMEWAQRTVTHDAVRERLF